MWRSHSIHKDQWIFCHCQWGHLFHVHTWPSFSVHCCCRSIHWGLPPEAKRRIWRCHPELLARCCRISFSSSSAMKIIPYVTMTESFDRHPRVLGVHPFTNQNSLIAFLCNKVPICYLLMMWAVPPWWLLSGLPDQMMISPKLCLCFPLHVYLAWWPQLGQSCICLTELLLVL